MIAYVVTYCGYDDSGDIAVFTEETCAEQCALHIFGGEIHEIECNPDIGFLPHNARRYKVSIHKESGEAVAERNDFEHLPTAEDAQESLYTLDGLYWRGSVWAQDTDGAIAKMRTLVTEQEAV